MLIRSDMSGMSVLSGRRASVESFPMWWAFPTSEYYVRRGMTLFWTPVSSFSAWPPPVGTALVGGHHI